MTAALHHTVDGAAHAPPVVLLGSLGSTTAMWQPQVAGLGDRLRLVRVDLRGHGLSPAPPGPYTIAELGEDVVAVMDRLDLARAHVVGLSLGGMVGLWLAAHHPARVDRLVACCTSARLEPASAWRQRAETVRVDGVAAIADAVLERWLTPQHAAGHPDRVERLRAMLLATPAEGYAGCCEAIAAMDLRGDLPHVVAPTLAVAGVHDPATPTAHLAAIADGVPDGRLVEVDAAHLAAVEDPGGVNAAIADHLAATPSPGA